MKVRGLWGLEIEPSITTQITVDGAFKITMASISSFQGSERTSVYMEFQESRFVLCSLIPEKIEQQVIDITCLKGEQITFRSVGPNGIHLMGNFISQEDSESELEEDEREETIVNYPVNTMHDISSEDSQEIQNLGQGDTILPEHDEFDVNRICQFLEKTFPSNETSESFPTYNSNSYDPNYTIVDLDQLHDESLYNLGSLPAETDTETSESFPTYNSNSYDPNYTIVDLDQLHDESLYNLGLSPAETDTTMEEVENPNTTKLQIPASVANTNSIVADDYKLERASRSKSHGLSENRIIAESNVINNNQLEEFIKEVETTEPEIRFAEYDVEKNEVDKMEDDNQSNEKPKSRNSTSSATVRSRTKTPAVTKNPTTKESTDIKSISSRSKSSEIKIPETTSAVDKTSVTSEETKDSRSESSLVDSPVTVKRVSKVRKPVAMSTRSKIPLKDVPLEKLLIEDDKKPNRIHESKSVNKKNDKNVKNTQPNKSADSISVGETEMIDNLVADSSIPDVNTSNKNLKNSKSNASQTKKSIKNKSVTEETVEIEFVKPDRIINKNSKNSKNKKAAKSKSVEKETVNEELVEQPIDISVDLEKDEKAQVIEIEEAPIKKNTVSRKKLAKKESSTDREEDTEMESTEIEAPINKSKGSKKKSTKRKSLDDVEEVSIRQKEDKNIALIEVNENSVKTSHGSKKIKTSKKKSKESNEDTQSNIDKNQNMEIESVSVESTDIEDTSNKRRDSKTKKSKSKKVPEAKYIKEQSIGSLEDDFKKASDQEEYIVITSAESTDIENTVDEKKKKSKSKKAVKAKKDVKDLPADSEQIPKKKVNDSIGSKIIRAATNDSVENEEKTNNLGRKDNLEQEGTDIHHANEQTGSDTSDAKNNDKDDDSSIKVKITQNKETDNQESNQSFEDLLKKERERKRIVKLLKKKRKEQKEKKRAAKASRNLATPIYLSVQESLQNTEAPASTPADDISSTTGPLKNQSDAKSPAAKDIKEQIKRNPKRKASDESADKLGELARADARMAKSVQKRRKR